MMKEHIAQFFQKFGYEIRRIDRSHSMVGALMRCVNRGVEVNSIIDVGASDGRWSETCMYFFPNARYLLFEAQLAHQNGLEQFCKKNSNASYILAAAGNRTGKIFFDHSDLFGGFASEVPLNNHYREVLVTTIDAEVNKRGLKPPFLIKLDTHGFEIPILDGAVQTIPMAGLIIIETYNYQLTPESKKYFEMSQYMEGLGFSPIEVVDLLLRKKDHSLWQMDTFFIPSKSKEFDYHLYE